MNALAPWTPDTLRRISSLLLFLGITLLLGTWVVLYWSESLFTESHLVGYYCCVTEQDLPAVGTWERALSDFFRASPGKHVPSVVFVVVNAGIFASRMLKARRKAWLPFLFVLFNVVYLAVDFWLVGISWTISEWALGPVLSAYKGYDRTWYGIVLHLLSWGIFFFVMVRVSRLSTAKEP
jgi:hypothetical protein